MLRVNVNANISAVSAEGNLQLFFPLFYALTTNRDFMYPQLGYDGHLCATGKGLTVEFYDLRKAGARLGAYSESHTDAVTQVM